MKVKRTNLWKQGIISLDLNAIATAKWEQSSQHVLAYYTLEILHMSSGEKRISADNSKRYTNMIKNDRKRASQIVNNQIKFQSATD